jgi:hypothetical protein
VHNIHKNPKKYKEKKNVSRVHGDMVTWGVVRVSGQIVGPEISETSIHLTQIIEEGCQGTVMDIPEQCDCNSVRFFH